MVCLGEQWSCMCDISIETLCNVNTDGVSIYTVFYNISIHYHQLHDNVCTIPSCMHFADKTACLMFEENGLAHKVTQRARTSRVHECDFHIHMAVMLPWNNNTATSLWGADAPSLLPVVLDSGQHCDTVLLVFSGWSHNSCVSLIQCDFFIFVSGILWSWAACFGMLWVYWSHFAVICGYFLISPRYIYV